MSANLWQRFMDGDDAAFSELYRRYMNELLAYGLKIGFNEEACKDAIQDVFYHLITKRDHLSHIQNVEFYLLQSLKNRLFDLYEVKSKLSRVDYDDIILDNEENVIDAIIERENELQLKNEIEKSLSVLPPKQRKIVFWHYHLNLSFAEIATILDAKPDTIRKSIHRALQKMREASFLKAISIIAPTLSLTLLG